VGSAHADSVINPDAVIAGKGLRRAGDFLDWTLGLYKNQGNATSFFGKEQVSTSKTLRDLWWFSFKMCIFLYLGIALVVGFSFILKASWVDRWRRNLPWLIISIGIAALSYLVLTFFMQLTANAMAIFIKDMDADQLLKISFSYTQITGLTNSSIDYLEVVRNTITLIKIATATAYAVGGVLLLRIVVLWMLTIVVPFIMPFVTFPITQSLGRIWVREFVRWLVIGPFIALFLFASNKIWVSNELPTGSTAGSSSVTSQYGPTGATAGTEINISTPTSGVSTFDTAGVSGAAMTSDTYSKYILSLIMLWVSIILPWLLLRFAMTFITEASTKWYEKNRESAMVKQLERLVRPQAPPPRPGGPAGEMQGLKGRLGLPARELHLTPAIAQAIQRESQTRTQATTHLGAREKAAVAARFGASETTPMSVMNILKLSGLTQIGETAAKLQEGKESHRSLLAMTQLEQQPALFTSVASEVSKLQHPEMVQNQTEQQKIKDLKNNLILNEAKAGHGARSIVATMKNDTSHLASQSLKNEMREKTFSTIKENATKVLQNNSIQDTETQNQIKQLTQLIARYQQTTSGKQLEKIDLGQQIDKMAKAVAAQIEHALPGKHEAQANAYRQGETMARAMSGEEKKDRQATGGAMNAPTGGLAAGLTIHQTDPGRALVKSLRFLNMRELSYTSSDAGIGKLLVQEPSLEDTVPDTAMITDYEESKQQWLKYYRAAPVPVSETIKSRADWLASQIASQQEALNKISSEDYNQRRDGLSQLSKIMPFLLMGDYTLTEVILYLKAKIVAAGQVKQEQQAGGVTSPEQEPEKVELEKPATAEPKTMALDPEAPKM
jgi:hypothetical protein